LTTDQASQARGLAEDSDADLLGYMSLAADDPAGAKAAWAEFYRRHVRYLYAVCLRAYGPLLGGEAGVADLVAETFKRVYEHADKFDAVGLTDPDQLRLRTRAWLGRIAQRLAQTALRGRSRMPTKLFDHDYWQSVSQQDVPAGDSKTSGRVRAAIESLDEREQIVIRTTFQWYQPDKQHQRLPNDVAADLAANLATTPENLRQIRRRAMRKIREYLIASAGAGETR